MGTLPSGLSFGGEDVPNMWAREPETTEAIEEPTTMAALLPKDLMQCLQRADEPEAKVREAVKKQRERPPQRQAVQFGNFLTMAVSTVRSQQMMASSIFGGLGGRNF